METYTGLIVDPLNIHPDQIVIEDIAHALAFQCRFNGHCREFYSIAQHSILMALKFTNTVMQLYGLFHDAAEAYLGDMISPLKKVMPEFKTHEQTLQNRIFTKFCYGTPEYRHQQRLKECDTALLIYEAYHLMPSRGLNWREEAGLVPRTEISFRTPKEAEKEFLDMANLFRSLI